MNLWEENSPDCGPEVQLFLKDIAYISISHDHFLLLEKLLHKLGFYSSLRRKQNYFSNNIQISNNLWCVYETWKIENVRLLC